MISNKFDLKDYLKSDNYDFNKKSKKEKLISKFCRYPEYSIMRFKKYLRYSEFYFNTCKNNKLRYVIALWYERKKNILGEKLGIEIEPNCFGKGLIIYHGGNIVINPNVRAGENCALHGGNCIGNNGNTKDVPYIGNNVDIGFQACVIGGIVLEDNITIGSGAVVVKSCEKKGATLVGVPAREI